MAADNRPNPAVDAAIKILAARNLHQCLWLRPSETHARLRVTFSTTSNFHDASLPVVLFCGPMFGTRYLIIPFDELAKNSGVRMICVDRPGFGGSTQVSLEKRMDVWLEMVPALLQHLGIEHVSLVSHSAGTIYLLNTIYHHRQILDPKSPYAAMVGPWVSQRHSNVTMLSAAAKLPNSVLSAWSPLVNFINNTITPMTSWSGGVMSSVSGASQPETGGSLDDSSAQEKYGVDAATAKELERLWSKWSSEEQAMVGGNDEARLLLGKGPVGVCEDYMEYVKLLVAAEQAQHLSRLEVQLCFAEDDMMIGKTGKDYFEQCWKQEAVHDAIGVETRDFRGTNHETVLVDTQRGAMKMIFDRIAAGE
ncbi:hypothetical protein AC579_3532 [Pseudocercospora musae]|uniref:AB hydrolase-1 domain-containing protein n=1 Tax=Pseudocercospora musae TaxID=113226 RepID=A0A139IVS6_9PEZI|nr:hypothetical protein AC579_3532 [Pseudocercospora musae]